MLFGLVKKDLEKILRLDVFAKIITSLIQLQNFEENKYVPEIFLLRRLFFIYDESNIFSKNKNYSVPIYSIYLKYLIYVGILESTEGMVIQTGTKHNFLRISKEFDLKKLYRDYSVLL